MKNRAVRLLCALALALPAPTGALAQQASSSSPSSSVITVADGVSQHVYLPLNKQRIVSLPRDARDVIIANPLIVDAIVRTPRHVTLLGLQSGETSVYFLDSAGNQIMDLQVRVDRDMSQLSDMLRRYVPDASIGVDAIGGDIVLTGAVPSSIAAM